jgi:hypothetical protein
MAEEKQMTTHRIEAVFELNDGQMKQLDKIKDQFGFIYTESAISWVVRTWLDQRIRADKLLEVRDASPR